MSSPIQHVVQWYQSLPVPQRADIAAFLSYAVPGFGSIDATAMDTMAEDFLSLVRSYSTSSIKEVGTVLTLRANIEFFFIRHRADRAGWNHNEQMLQDLANEDVSETFQRLANEIPLRREQWIKTCEKWDELCRQQLDDSTLEAWLESRLKGPG